MLQPRHILYTALEGALLDSSSRQWAPAEPALMEIERRHVPMVLCSGGTRAQLEPLRRKIGHAHPFVTENGGGLFLPDGYFSLRIEGGVRTGRYFCVAFGKDAAAASAALQEIAEEADASVVGYSQMSARDLASNTGMTLPEAELARQCEFSERFFFVGDVETSAGRFAEAAKARGWEATPVAEPFRLLSSGNDVGRAIRMLMKLFKTSTRTRLSSVAIGSTMEHLPLLLAVDKPIVLPKRGHEFDEELLGRLSKHVTKGTASGPAGWNQAMLALFEES